MKTSEMSPDEVEEFEKLDWIPNLHIGPQRAIKVARKNTPLWFKLIRKHLKMTQADMAKEMGVTTRTIITWESVKLPKYAALAITSIALKRVSA